MSNKTLDIDKRDICYDGFFTIRVRKRSEKTVIQAIEEMIAENGYKDKVRLLFLPTTVTSAYSTGNRSMSSESLYPGQIYIDAELSLDLIRLIENIPGVIDIDTSRKFPTTRKNKRSPSNKKKDEKIRQQVTSKSLSGRPVTKRSVRYKKITTATKKFPHSITREEVRRIAGITKEIASGAQRSPYAHGNPVRIISGPFSDFEGVVSKVNSQEKKLTVKVAIFGKSTPVDLNMDQVKIIKKGEE